MMIEHLFDIISAVSFFPSVRQVSRKQWRTLSETGNGWRQYLMVERVTKN